MGTLHTYICPAEIPKVHFYAILIMVLPLRLRKIANCNYLQHQGWQREQWMFRRGRVQEGAGVSHRACYEGSLNHQYISMPLQSLTSCPRHYNNYGCKFLICTDIEVCQCQFRKVSVHSVCFPWFFWSMSWFFDTAQVGHRPFVLLKINYQYDSLKLNITATYEQT